MRWFRGLPAVEAEVPGTGGHRVLWRRGSLVLLDHGTADLVLAALGGESCPCLRVRALARAPRRPTFVEADVIAGVGARLGPTPQHARFQGLIGTRPEVVDGWLRRLLDRDLLRRLAVGWLVSWERSNPDLGSLEPAVATLATIATRLAFGPVARRPVAVEVALVAERFGGDASLLLGRDGPRVSLAVSLGWVRRVALTGAATPGGGRLVVGADGRTVRLERTRSGLRLVEAEATALRYGE